MNKLSYEISLEDFRTTYKEYDNIYYAMSKSCGISESEYLTLLMIFEGVTKQTKISEQLLLSKQTVNSACMKLIKRGYIRLEAEENNLRTKQIVLTELGLVFAKENISCIAKAEEWAWNELSSEERRLMVDLTRKYTRYMKSQLKNYIK